MDVLLKYLFSFILLLTPYLASIGDCEVIVEIDQGKLNGKTNLDKNGGTYYSFMSIPYAKPPVGKLRFKAPESAESWTGTRDATIDLPFCPQNIVNGTTGQLEQIGQEDCLYLTVFSPKIKVEEGEKLLPAMVYVHGGAYTEGSGNTDYYGAEYLMPTGVVLVMMNYRLGMLGFSSSTDNSIGVPGNAGLKDQVMALKWVQKNIKKFGGDPDNVTLFGQSAGGGSVHHQMLSPMSKGLFHRVIAMSGTASNSWNRGVKGSMEIKAKKLNVPTDDKMKMLEMMQEMPLKNILEAQYVPAGLLIPIHVPFEGSPVVETQTDSEVFLPALPKDIIKSGTYNKVPLIAGYTNVDGLVVQVIFQLLFGKPNYIGDFAGTIPSDLKLTAEERMAVGNKIKSFYFGSEDSNEKNLAKGIDLATDISFAVGVVNTVKRHVANDDTVYLYRFGADTELNYFKKLNPVTAAIPGACHIDDIGYVFKTKITAPFEKGSVEDKAIDTIVALWTNFAKYGTPTTPESSVKWLPVTKDAMNYMEIDTTLKAGVSPDKERQDFWNELYTTYEST